MMRVRMGLSAWPRFSFQTFIIQLPAKNPQRGPSRIPFAYCSICTVNNTVARVKEIATPNKELDHDTSPDADTHIAAPSLAFKDFNARAHCQRSEGKGGQSQTLLPQMSGFFFLGREHMPDQGCVAKRLL